jgi:alpha-beta hydrolase superfamily lysophospholipase
MNQIQDGFLPGTTRPGFELVPPGARAGLLIVHGIAEHSGRYRHVAASLAQRGLASFSYDQRAHGRTSGTRTHVPDFKMFAADMHEMAAAVTSRHSNLPLYVWGHSMGSVVVTQGAVGGLPWARGVITSGSALAALPSLKGWRGAGLNLANTVAPRLRISLRVDAKVLMQVEEFQRAHMSDPLVPRTASLRLLYGFAQACALCDANLGNIRLPWLALHGQSDTVCPPRGSVRLIEGLGSPDKQLMMLPGLLHEPHNEAEEHRNALFDTMANWINKRL